MWNCRYRKRDVMFRAAKGLCCSLTIYIHCISTLPTQHTQLLLHAPSIFTPIKRFSLKFEWLVICSTISAAVYYFSILFIVTKVVNSCCLPLYATYALTLHRLRSLHVILFAQNLTKGKNWNTIKVKKYPQLSLKTKVHACMIFINISLQSPSYPEKWFLKDNQTNHC